MEFHAYKERALIAGISDLQLSASSSTSNKYDIERSRLHTMDTGIAGGCWRPNVSQTDEWIQVDLGLPHKISSVATQGRYGTNEWVTKYTLQHSLDGQTWTIYKEDNNEKVIPGNTDRDTVRTNRLIPFTARFVRLNPKEWYAFISLRWELYGFPLGVSFHARRVAPIQQVGADVNLTYEDVQSNQGDGLDPDIGFFEAPRHAMYCFYVTTRPVAGRTYSEVHLVHEGASVLKVYGITGQGNGSASGTVVLELEKEEKVLCKLIKGSTMEGDGWSYFGGYLLYDL